MGCIRCQAAFVIRINPDQSTAKLADPEGIRCLKYGNKIA